MQYITHRAAQARIAIQAFIIVACLALVAQTSAPQQAFAQVVDETEVSENVEPTPTPTPTPEEEGTNEETSEESDTEEEQAPAGLQIVLPDCDEEGAEIEEDNIEQQTENPCEEEQPKLAPCVDGHAGVNEVVSSSQGTLNNGSPITDPTRTNPDKTLDTADGEFFSLGKDGQMVVSFAGYALDVPGADLHIHEITNNRDTYPLETAKIEVSQDTVSWITLGNALGTNTDGVSSFDISPTGLAWITMVRITEQTNFALHDATADGFDVDSVEATHQSCILVEPTKESSYNSETGVLSYTIHWIVLGEGEADVTITDELPAGVTYVAASADNGGVYDNGTRTITWSLGLKGAGEFGAVTFQATLDAFTALNMWAKTVVSFSQGLKANLTDPVDANRSNPAKALGVAQSAGSIYDNPLPTFLDEFVSLGFTEGTTGGQLVVVFDQPVTNGPGNDLKVFEITSGDSYPDESVTVAVSDDNATWTNVGVVVRDGEVDLGSATSANYIRLTETSDRATFDGDADGFDVDAIKAFHVAPQVCDVKNTAFVHWPILFGDSSLVIAVPASVVTTINEESCADDFAISGQKWEDVDGDGTKDEGEEGLSGWTIYIDANNNGAKDDGEATATTDGSGNYAFTDLTPGLYIVREVNQAGWDQTYPTAESFGKHVVFITSFDITGKDFGNHNNGQGGSGGSGNPTAAGNGSITGVVFNDENNNGVKDEGEAQLSGWVVYLDTNDSSTLDGGEQTRTTASPYTFTGLVDATYNVRVVVQADWVQTLPGSGSSFKHVAIVSGGNAVTGKDFGIYHPTTGGGGSAITTSTTSGGGGGGSTPTPTPTVAGDSTNQSNVGDPSANNPTPGNGGGEGLPMPAVLGATELPRTGNGIASILLALLLGASVTASLRKIKTVL